MTQTILLLDDLLRLGLLLTLVVRKELERIGPHQQFDLKKRKKKKETIRQMHAVCYKGRTCWSNCSSVQTTPLPLLSRRISSALYGMVWYGIYLCSHLVPLTRLLALNFASSSTSFIAPSFSSSSKVLYALLTAIESVSQ